MIFKISDKVRKYIQLDTNFINIEFKSEFNSVSGYTTFKDARSNTIYIDLYSLDMKTPGIKYRYKSILNMGKVLLHELTHVRQLQEFDTYREAKEKYFYGDYKDRPGEKEARMAEDAPEDVLNHAMLIMAYALNGKNMPYFMKY